MSVQLHMPRERICHVNVQRAAVPIAVFIQWFRDLRNEPVFLALARARYNETGASHRGLRTGVDVYGRRSRYTVPGLARGFGCVAGIPLSGVGYRALAHFGRSH